MLPRTVPPAYSPIPASAVAAPWRRPTVGAAQELESILLNRYRANAVILPSSGTEALEIALRLVDGPIAIPAFGCYSIASSVVGANTSVRLYDVDPDTLGPDFDSLRRACRNGVRAIVVASLFGTPIDYDTVDAIAQEFGILWIEDAAQGHGAEWRGRPLGSFGHASVLSFGRGKGWTGGGGGALLLREPMPGISTELPTEVLGRLELGLRLVLQQAFSSPRLYALPAAVPALRLGETVYHPPQPARRLHDRRAAAILRTDEASRIEATRRRARGRAMRELLAGCVAVRFAQVHERGVAGELRLPVRLEQPAPEGSGRLGLLRSYPMTLDQLGPLKARILGGGHHPGAANLAHRLHTVPTHSRTTTADVERLVVALRSVGGGTQPEGVAPTQQSRSDADPALLP